MIILIVEIAGVTTDIEIQQTLFLRLLMPLVQMFVLCYNGPRACFSVCETLPKNL